MMLSCLQSALGFLLSYKGELNEVWNGLVLSALLQPCCITDMSGKYSASIECSSESKWYEEKILPWTEQTGGPRETEGHDASNAEWSGSGFLCSFAVYWSLVLHPHLHWEEEHLSPRLPQPTTGPPLSFFTMGIKGYIKHWADSTYQVPQPTGFRGFLVVGPPINSSWFWNVSSMKVSQSWQSSPWALSAQALPSQSAAAGEREERTHQEKSSVTSPHTKAALGCATSSQKYLGLTLTARVGEMKLWTWALRGKIELEREEFM